MKYILTKGRSERPSREEAEAFVERCGWFAPARVVREILTGEPDAQLAVTAPWRTQSSLRMPAIDAEALRSLTSDDLIDRFLREEDLRIVAEEGEPDTEVLTQAELDEEDEIVSEQLAEIYRAQGLCDKAIAIYRKLSLLNPEKSVYFAELIGKTESDKTENN